MNERVRRHQRLKELRVACKLSQDELGYQAEVAQARLSRAERGYTKLNAEECKRIARILRVSVDSVSSIVGEGAVKGDDGRPSFELIHMKMAGLVRQRSTCSRLQVGCIIASSDFRKILAMGYNGNASGLPNECDSEEVGKCGCLHAEENAVINCDSPRQWTKIVFCTHLPCKMCAKRLVNLGGVQKVYYAHDYRLKEGLDVLAAAGIEFQQMDVLNGEEEESECAEQG